MMAPEILPLEGFDNFGVVLIIGKEPNDLKILYPSHMKPEDIVPSGMLVGTIIGALLTAGDKLFLEFVMERFQEISKKHKGIENEKDGAG